MLIISCACVFVPAEFFLFLFNLCESSFIHPCWFSVMVISRPNWQSFVWYIFDTSCSYNVTYHCPRFINWKFLKNFSPVILCKTHLHATVIITTVKINLNDVFLQLLSSITSESPIKNTIWWLWVTISVPYTPDYESYQVHLLQADPEYSVAGLLCSALVVWNVGTKTNLWNTTQICWQHDFQKH